MRITAILLLGAAVAAAGAACVPLQASTREREITRTFQVSPGDALSVEVSGGSIVVRTGTSDTVKATVTERVQADSDREADERLSHYDVVLEQDGDHVVVRARLKPGFRGWVNGVSFRAEVEAPAGVALDLHTSGGRISVAGERTAPVAARTSGGSVRVDAGSDIDVRTSGGSIEIGQAPGRLVARTSGGSIRVGHVGAASREVQLSTSGGSIRASLDRAAAFDIDARTSGGSVSVTGLPVTRGDTGRSRFTGAVNGGGGRFSAHTSGGSIRITGAD